MRKVTLIFTDTFTLAKFIVDCHISNFLVNCHVTKSKIDEKIYALTAKLSEDQIAAACTKYCVIAEF